MNEYMSVSINQLVCLFSSIPPIYVVTAHCGLIWKITEFAIGPLLLPWFAKARKPLLLAEKYSTSNAPNVATSCTWEEK